MQPLYLIIILIVIAGFFAFVMMVPQEEIDYESEARQLITRFSENEYIGFDVDPTPPVTEYHYESKNITKTITLQNGTQVNQTETIYEKVEEPTSGTISVTAQGRTTTQVKVCQIGHHCDLSGIISLQDPNTGKKLDPPYSFLLTVDCDYRDHCSLSPTPSWNLVTFPDGTWKHTIVITDAPYSPGEYQATVFVKSYMKNIKDNERTGTMILQVIK